MTLRNLILCQQSIAEMKLNDWRPVSVIREHAADLRPEGGEKQQYNRKV